MSSFVCLQKIDPDTMHVLPEIVIARVEPDGTLRVVHDGSNHFPNEQAIQKVRQACRALPAVEEART